MKGRWPAGSQLPHIHRKQIKEKLFIIWKDRCIRRNLS
jgi:hypothetical protein